MLKDKESAAAKEKETLQKVPVAKEKSKTPEPAKKEASKSPVSILFR